MSSVPQSFSYDLSTCHISLKFSYDLSICHMFLKATFLYLMFLPSLTEFLAAEVMVRVNTRAETKANLPPAVTFCLYNQSK